MKERNFIEFARSVPVLTTKQVAAQLGNAAYAKLYLHRMAKRGIVKRVARGFYTAHEDPVIYASHLRYPSYISLWYAFQHHGATTQLPRVIEVMARTAGKAEGVEIFMSEHLWGYGPARYAGFQIFMADLEKAVIDAIGRMPLDDVGAAIAKCDPKKLEGYALRFDAATMKKVGYVADGVGVSLEKLHERTFSDRNYVHMGERIVKNRWKVVA